MINSVRRRLNIIKSKLRNDEYLRHSQWRDVAHEVFKRYGRLKADIKKGMSVERVDDMSRVEIDGRIIYWPLKADVSRLVDMYFEVFNDNNNHCFDTKETPIRYGDTVLDCGACEGYFTMKALEKGAHMVYAVEPGAAMTSCLRKSISESIYSGRAAVYQYLLGEANKKLKIHENEDDPTITHIFDDQAIDKATTKLTGGHVVTVEMITIDELCKRYSIKKIDYIKVDVEGSEVDLINGALETIKKHKPTMAIGAYHMPENVNRIIDIIQALDLGYSTSVKGIVDFDGIPRPIIIHCESDARRLEHKGSI
jgi:FkbM family methyltransferase